MTEDESTDPVEQLLIETREKEFSALPDLPGANSPAPIVKELRAAEADQRQAIAGVERLQQQLRDGEKNAAAYVREAVGIGDIAKAALRARVQKAEQTAASIETNISGRYIPSSIPREPQYDSAKGDVLRALETQHPVEQLVKLVRRAVESGDTALRKTVTSDWTRYELADRGVDPKLAGTIKTEALAALMEHEEDPVWKASLELVLTGRLRKRVIAAGHHAAYELNDRLQRQLAPRRSLTRRPV